MRYRQIWDDLASSDKLAKLTDGEERLFWALWASQVITDDYGNFRWNPQKILLGCIPGRKRWNAVRIEKELQGLCQKGLLSRYEANGKGYGHLCDFINRTVVGRNHRRVDHCPSFPNDIGQPALSSAEQGQPALSNDDNVAIPSPSPSPSPAPTPAPEKKEIKKESYTPEFETFWQTYPERPANPKSIAFEKWQAQLKKGATIADMVFAAKNYSEYCDEAGVEPAFRMMARTFLGPHDRFRDFVKGVPEIATATEKKGPGSEIETGLQILKEWEANDQE